jgi:hypothetical protein
MLDESHAEIEDGKDYRKGGCLVPPSLPPSLYIDADGNLVSSNAIVPFLDFDQ